MYKGSDGRKYSVQEAAYIADGERIPTPEAGTRRSRYKKGRKRIMFWVDDHGEWEYCPEMPEEGNYHVPAAKELYAIIKQEEQVPSASLRRSQWEAICDDAYGQLGDLCGVSIDEYDSVEDFLEGCSRTIEGELF